MKIMLLLNLCAMLAARIVFMVEVWRSVVANANLLTARGKKLPIKAIFIWNDSKTDKWVFRVNKRQPYLCSTWLSLCNPSLWNFVLFHNNTFISKKYVNLCKKMEKSTKVWIFWKQENLRNILRFKKCELKEYNEDRSLGWYFLSRNNFYFCSIYSP